MQGRQLQDNTRKVCNMIDYVNQKMEPSLMMFCDAEKAFDQVQWDFFKEGLRKMNFV